MISDDPAGLANTLTVVERSLRRLALRATLSASFDRALTIVLEISRRKLSALAPRLHGSGWIVLEIAA